MNSNLTQQLQLDQAQIQKIYWDTLNDAIKAAYRPKEMSWFQTVGSFINSHPLVFFASLILVALLIFLITREIVCTYFKTNEILSRVKRLEERLGR